MASTRNVLSMTKLLAATAGELEMDNDMHPVKKITFGMQQELDAASTQADDTASLDAVRSVVAQLVPTLSPDQLKRIDFDAAKAITSMAAGGIEAVEKLFPNAVSPVSTTSPG